MSGVVAVWTLAQDAAEEPSLGGWYVGFAIGFAIVVVVVVIVVAILTLASRIGRQAYAAVDALNVARNNTLPLWDVRTTNEHTRAILQAARTTREAVEAS